MHLYIQKDRANNQVYIGFAPDRAGLKRVAKKTVPAGKDIALDFDSKGRLLGIDISNAARVLGRKVFDSEFSGDELVGVAEAAKLCGVKKPNFVRDFADKPGFPKPAVELASGRIWLRSDIEAYSRRAKHTSQAPASTTIQPTLSMALGEILARDELAFRHNALTYFSRRFIHGGVPRPPSIEELTMRSIEEDKSVASQAQAGDVDLYVQAAWSLIAKYSPALDSFLQNVIPQKAKEKASQISKQVWVDALQRIQRGEYGPDSQISFTAWVLALVRDTLRSHGFDTPSAQRLLSDVDPLEQAVQAKRYAEALSEHDRAVESLRSELLVLEYVRGLSVDEIAQFVLSDTKHKADTGDVMKARRLGARRLRDVRKRLA